MTTEIGFTHQSGVTVHTVPEAFQQTVMLRPDQVALRTVGGTQQITWRDYDRRVRAIAAGLAKLGVRHGDTVALMLTNRPEFNLVDTAALHLGATPFSVYNTSSAEQIKHLFTNAENRIAVTERAFLDAVRGAGVDLEHLIVVDGPAADTLSLADVEADPAPDFDFDAAWQAVRPDDLVTLIYTSGTTGPSKGVEITHSNVVAQIAGLMRGPLIVGLDDRGVSYLPAAHVADRISGHCANLFTGIALTCVPDPREIAAALPDARPTAFFGVPRVWQKLKAGIDARLATEPSPVKKALAHWALGVGVAAARARLTGGPARPLLAVQHTLADALVLSKLRAALGMDELRVASSGAAAIPPETLEFLLGLGFTVTEVWGMSETSGVGTFTELDKPRPGSVGRALDGVELRLDTDGELLVRGAIVTPGYRKMPDKTAEAIDADGWLHTGDVATIDADGYVTIVDRKKELIITEAGKNISPTNIENAVKAASSLVGQVVAVGDARPYITALIVLDPDTAAVRAKTLGIPDAPLATLATRPELVEEITAAVRSGNTKISRVEQIKRFRILPTAWEPGGEEITPTLKLKRRPISTKYAAEIAELYGDAASDGVIDVK
ncbi:AMP-dependent synthetase/ligase [Nocardia terpenica]|uniref:Acyl-CoA synthetase n=1 Tax=Nocardia terpenica TaxID=455432 RepID=A0A164LT78_9NOCA|nr:long-chain fatty acid--CoA ligase [Nocardia terpenica]KZM72721.1 AMP-dependent synthetase [Nocardia terpenica]NQE92374.1 long-chain fatty acid--CoA ligase [Nocardia terpenica]